MPIFLLYYILMHGASTTSRKPQHALLFICACVLHTTSTHHRHSLLHHVFSSLHHSKGQSSVQTEKITSTHAVWTLITARVRPDKAIRHHKEEVHMVYSHTGGGEALNHYSSGLGGFSTSYPPLSSWWRPHCCIIQQWKCGCVT